MEVLIDGDQVFFTDGSSGLCGVTGYSLQTVDISAYADGGEHTLEFHSRTFGTNGGPSNFFVDDIGISSDCFWLSEDPVSGSTPSTQTQIVDISVDATGLPAATYFCKLVIDSNDPNESSVTVTVKLLVLAAVPIQLASFTATVVSQTQVQLDWTTLTEINNYGFEIQKAPDEPINYQTVPASFVPGHGTTNVPQHYSYTDATASLGTWYYRLKQIDLDGTVHYSDAVQVDVLTGVEEQRVPTAFALDQNYPNPFNPSTVISYSLPVEARVKLEVFSTLGERVATLVDENTSAGYYSARFDATGLTSGVYFYRFQAGDYVESKKLLLLR
jgi:hypothetical protein